jgi:S1-C subfamily serine protease
MTTSIEADLQRRLGLTQDKGVLVVEVQPDSPAAAASLRPLDMILTIGETATASVDALKQSIDAVRPGRSVEVAFIREGRLRKTHVVIGGARSGVVEAALRS